MLSFKYIIVTDFFEILVFNKYKGNKKDDFYKH